MNASTVSAIADIFASVASLGALVSAFRALRETRHQREMLAHQARFQTTPFVLLSIDRENPQPVIMNTGNTAALQINVSIPAGEINGETICCNYLTVPYLAPNDSALLKTPTPVQVRITKDNLKWLDADVSINYKDITGDSYANSIQYRGGLIHAIDAPSRYRFTISDNPI